MKIIVTQQDIDESLAIFKPGLVSGYTCPVARALCRALRGKKVHVCTNGYRILGAVHSSRYSGLPLEAKDFIRAFDKGDQVAPIEFEIDEN